MTRPRTLQARREDYCAARSRPAPILSRRKVLVAAVVALAAALVFLAPLPAGCHTREAWSLMAISGILLGSLSLVVQSLRETGRARFDPVLAALVALLALVLVQLMPLPAALVEALSPRRLALAREAALAAGAAPPARRALPTCLGCTRDRALMLAAYIAVFYASSTVLCRHRRWKIVFAAAVAGAALLSVHGFVQLLSADVAGGSGGTWRLTSTFVNPNRLAALLTMASACATGLWLASGNGRRPTRLVREPGGSLWVVPAVVILAALVLTLSRLGLASALAAAAITGVVYTRGRRLRLRRVAALVTSTVSLALALGPVVARFGAIIEQELGGGGRHVCWRQALPLARDFALTGSGAGTFRHAFRLYQDPSLPGWHTFAHNEYLNLLCDVGIAGLAAAAVAIFLLLRGVLSLRDSNDRASRAIGVAGLAGVAALLTHSVADFPLQEPAVALLFFMLAGIVYGRARLRAGPTLVTAHQSSFALACRAGIALILCAATIPTLVRLHLNARLRRQASLADAGAERIALLERAGRLDPWDAEAFYEIARARVGRLAGGAPSRRSTRERTTSKPCSPGGRTTATPRNDPTG